MSLSSLQKIQLSKAVGAAEVAQASTGCPVELSVAQWALESGWGLRQPGNNCFGIKIFPGCCGVQFIDTWEVENGKKVCKRLAFSTFPQLSDCFKTHGELIAKGFAYRKSFADYAETKDIFKLIVSIAKVYATDPDYASKLINILSMSDVQSALGSKV